jgi:hypothetical protein
MEELELAPLDVALAVGDEGEHSLLGDVVVGAVGGFVVALLELGALERRRVTHGAAADGLLERGGGGVGMECVFVNLVVWACWRCPAMQPHAHEPTTRFRSH